MSDDSKSGKRPWEDLLYGALDKLASAPGKLKDPKESVAAALEWMKSAREDIQQRLSEDISKRISELDWESLMKSASEHIADHYDLEIKVSLKRKTKKPNASKK